MNDEEDDEPMPVKSSKLAKKIRYYLAFILVRPIRWFFSKMVRNYRLHLWPKWNYWEWADHWWQRVRWPNVHWWILYHTVFNFFHWLHWRAWCKFCTYEKGFLAHKPWYAAVIHRIGEFTAGGAVNCFECWHCGAKEGCQIDLSDSEDPEEFILLRTWSVGTMDGTDHRFHGITICPKCGYRSEIEEGSL